MANAIICMIEFLIWSRLLLIQNTNLINKKTVFINTVITRCYKLYFYEVIIFSCGMNIAKAVFCSWWYFYFTSRTLICHTTCQERLKYFFKFDQDTRNIWTYTKTTLISINAINYLFHNKTGLSSFCNDLLKR